MSEMNRTAALFSLLLSLCSLACDGGGDELATAGDETTSTTSTDGDGDGGGDHFASAFAGAWSGTYQDNDFPEIQGGVTSNVIVDEAAQTVTFTLDFDGPILDQNDPPEETFTGVYGDTSFSVSTQSVVFGAATLSFDIDGVISGGGTPPGFESIVFTGTGTATQITINYALSDGGMVLSTGSIELNEA